MTRPRIWMKMNRCRTNRELSFLSPSLLVWFDQKKKKKKGTASDYFQCWWGYYYRRPGQD